MDFVRHLALPKFDAQNTLHKRVASLAVAAARAAANEDSRSVCSIEKDLNSACAELFGIQASEVREVVQSLDEIEAAPASETPEDQEE
jgi:hypothetical protein